jgi:hypothetical protein
MAQSKPRRTSTKARRTSTPATGTRRRATTPPAQRWSQHVTETSDALDVEPNLFTKGSARQIALSLKRSAERSRRRKSTPFRAAMSMLTFYINRSGKNSSPSRLRVLNRAKDELRDAFHKAEKTRSS